MCNIKPLNEVLTLNILLFLVYILKKLISIKEKAEGIVRWFVAYVEYKHP